jgi:RNA recognition motif-containing protein
MAKNLYVGNLALQATSGDLTEVFGKFGTVHGARVVNDPQTGLCRGFGFVEMGDGAERAVAALHGSRFHGHTLTVYESV